MKEGYMLPLKHLSSSNQLDLNTLEKHDMQCKAPHFTNQNAVYKYSTSNSPSEN